VQLDSLDTVGEVKYSTEAAFLASLRVRRAVGPDLEMAGSIRLPETIDPSEIIGFDALRSFVAADYELDPAKNPTLTASERSGHFTPAVLERHLGGPFVHSFSARFGTASDSIAADSIGTPREFPPSGMPIAALERNRTLGWRDIMKIERTLQHVVRNTLVYSKAVWSSLTAEERVVMLEGYTIGLPAGGLDADGFTDPSQHVPLLNCIGNQVLGYYGNCMVMPFSIPASLAVALAGDSDDEDEGTREPLTNGTVQEALAQFHREAFAPPESHFTLPTRGVLGEAVLGHCTSAEKIDLTRFWNWQDSPADEATAIANVGLRANSLANLSAPATLSSLPTIVNNVAGEGGGSGAVGALAQALTGKAPDSASFSTDFLGHNVLTTLGGKTIDSAEAARKDALASATTMATKALDASVDVFKTKFAADKAAEEKAAADKAGAASKALGEAQQAAVKTLRDNAKPFLGVAATKASPESAREFADDVIKGLAGGPLPRELSARLFDAFNQEEGNPPTRTPASTAWLSALGLL
jgi:hypothetical protein